MKRFIFYALDQYTIKVLCRKEWEAGVQHGIACEQQRIIKLLENNKIPCDCGDTCGYYEIDYETVMALIKGEK